MSHTTPIITALAGIIVSISSSFAATEAQIDSTPSYVELETCLEMTPSGRANQ